MSVQAALVISLFILNLTIFLYCYPSDYCQFNLVFRPHILLYVWNLFQYSLGVVWMGQLGRQLILVFTLYSLLDQWIHFLTITIYIWCPEVSYDLIYLIKCFDLAVTQFEISTVRLTVMASLVLMEFQCSECCVLYQFQCNFLNVGYIFCYST